MILGVIISKTPFHHDSRGFFREIFRFPTEYADEKIGQLSHSCAHEGTDKRWHGHVYQSQWNYVVTGAIRVSLYDDRVDSPTFGELMEFDVDTDSNSYSYFFPHGVLHGYKCTRGPMNIIYVTSGCYEIADEVRKKTDQLCFLV